MDYEKFKRCLTEPCWFKGVQTLDPGIFNLHLAIANEEDITARTQLLEYVQRKAGVLRINGRLLEEIAAFNSIEEFIALLMFSGLPREVETLRELAKKYVKRGKHANT